MTAISYNILTGLRYYYYYMLVNILNLGTYRSQVRVRNGDAEAVFIVRHKFIYVIHDFFFTRPFPDFLMSVLN